ncbi:MAG: hypothetical protein QOG55_1092 [Acidobacteriaceae bacterium]|nr:hypothetical protein [Acidobacteriaceae bacterium]
MNEIKDQEQEMKIQFGNLTRTQIEFSEKGI